jgi:hypothetical protein
MVIEPKNSALWLPLCHIGGEEETKKHYAYKFNTMVVEFLLIQLEVTILLYYYNHLAH